MTEKEEEEGKFSCCVPLKGAFRKGKCLFVREMRVIGRIKQKIERVLLTWSGHEVFVGKIEEKVCEKVILRKKLKMCWFKA